MSLWGKWRNKPLGFGTKQAGPPPTVEVSGPMHLALVVAACVQCDDETLKAQFHPRSKAPAVHALCARLVMHARGGSRWARVQTITLLRYVYPKSKGLRLVSSRGRWSPPI